MKAVLFFEHLSDRLQPFPWLSIAGLLLALFAQSLLEPDARAAPAFVFYMASAGFVVWSVLKGEWKLTPPPKEADDLQTYHPHVPSLLAATILLAGAFLLFKDNRFTLLNLTLWLSGVGILVFSLWKPGHQAARKPVDAEWLVLLAAVLILAAFIRFYRLDGIPAEPFSDHAEKLLDVFDISQGESPVFFKRNTGREAIQMYWTVLIAQVFGTGISFLSLKLGTALLGFLTLPYMYLLGKEFGNPFVGFFGLFLFGIAYWPNVISRIGLRFPLYPLFAAATLLYLTRGLRARSPNDFILCGLFLGFGLHGYSPFRIMPFLVMTAFALFILHTKSKALRLQALWWLAIVAVTSLAVFLPLLRYWVEHPDIFGFRALSRLLMTGREFPGQVWAVFLTNLMRAILMFNRDDGNIWVNSIPHRPALDVVTGALFVIGLILLIARYVRGRDWRDLLLMLSIPLLLMPSVLSLAFPLENPALNRAGGAAVAAILISARALEGLTVGFGAEKRRAMIGYGIVAVLCSASALQNYRLVFHEFDESYRMTVWNSSEMADVIEEHGNLDTAWIVPYPQWVDTRLPAILLGDVNRDLALWPDGFVKTQDLPGSKLILFKPEDVQTENALKQLYPDGTLSRYTSINIGKDFMVFFVEE